MISLCDLVVPFVVIKAVVVIAALRHLNLLASLSNIVDLREVKDLLVFIRSEVLSQVLQCSLRINGILDVF